MQEEKASTKKTEVVITPPEQYGTQLAYNIRARTTLGVFTQLIAQANSHILIASPFLQTYYGFSESPIKSGLIFAVARNVRLDIITTGTGIKILKNGWPDLATRDNVRFFQPKPNIEDAKYLGSHAKCLVSDSQTAYVGSANFTQPGLFGNLELGLLVEGDEAAQIAAFWQYLIDIKFIIEVNV
jgi:phosphatidylserine/phosphatidylglycerophosphate/cardiolipin synthase-like enzyme